MEENEGTTPTAGEGNAAPASFATGGGELANPPADPLAEEVENGGNEPPKEGEPAKEEGKPASEGELTLESYKDLQLEKGALVSDDYIAELSKFALEHKLAPETAQALAERQAAQNKELLEAYHAIRAQKVQETERGWLKEIESKSNVAEIRANVDKAMTMAKAMPGFEDFVKVLDGEARLGSHPAVVEFLAFVGERLGEPGLQGGKPAGGSQAERSAAEVLYGGK